MNKQEFIYRSAAGAEYRLVVGDEGFGLYDMKTDELLVDASILVQGDRMWYWAIECAMSTSNREFYFTHKPNGDNREPPVVTFGMSRRDE